MIHIGDLNDHVAVSKNSLSGLNQNPGESFDQRIETGKRFTKFFQQDGEAPTRPASVTIGRPVAEIWEFVRDLKNMPRFICGLERVDIISEKVSHWVFNREGKKHEHDSEIIAEEANRLFAWKSIEGKGESQSRVGVVMLDEAPGGRGTVVSMKMSDDGEPGKIAGFLKHEMSQDPKSESYINLRRMKALIETGEVPTVEGQPNGRDEDNNLRKN